MGRQELQRGDGRAEGDAVGLSVIHSSGLAEKGSTQVGPFSFGVTVALAAWPSSSHGVPD